MFRIPGVTCPPPLQYYNSIYNDFQTFYDKPYPTEYTVFDHETKIENQKVLRHFLEYLQKWRDPLVFKECVELIKTTPLQELIEKYIVQNPVINQHPSLISLVKKHQPIIDQYCRFLKKHVEHFIEIHDGYYQQMFQNDGSKYLMTFPWTGVDLCLSYFLKNRLEFSYPHFYVNLSYVHMDNFLDCATTTPKDKKRLVTFCSQRLLGMSPEPYNLETTVCHRLTTVLEKHKPRSEFPYIYANILQMGMNEYHVSKAVKLISPEDDRLLCQQAYLKGVQSAFTTLDIFDQHYITKDEQWIFFARIAFILQLTDDLRDIKEDQLEGNRTFFSGKSGLALEEAVRALAKFGMYYMIPRDSLKQAFDYDHSIENSADIVGFVVLSSIHYSMIKNRYLFREEFIKELEAFVPCYYQEFQDMIEYRTSGRLEAWVKKTMGTIYQHVFSNKDKSKN